jgi:homoserine O-acetyltransferase/O-succinyltransferase
MPENLSFKYQEAFQLECGVVLPEIEIAYSTYGEMNAAQDNVLWVCHALTGNANVVEWWDGLVGDGRYFDPKDYFIICANVLGSHYGSTNALSINPLTGEPYFQDFPIITIRDVVKGLNLLRLALGINSVHTIIGGSLGGQQAIEWAILEPGIFKRLVLIATNAVHSPWGIAFNESQRMAVEFDPSWKLRRPDAGMAGMKVARSIALLSYRNYETYQRSQQRESDQYFNFRACTYQNYQGEKLAKRFNAFSYFTLSKMMDSHDVSRNRDSMDTVLAEIKTPTLIIGISTDLLFPPNEQAFLAEKISHSTFKIIDSVYGHDGFLIEYEELEQILKEWNVGLDKYEL